MLNLKKKNNEMMAFSLLSAITLISFALLLINFIFPPVSFDTEKIIVIPSGVSTTRISEILYEEGVIKNSFFFRSLVSLRGKENLLKPGYYKIFPGDNILDIINELVKGDVLHYKVTIPEGNTINDIARVLEKAGDISQDEFREAVQEIRLSYDYLPSDVEGIDYFLQGYLFPATYTFPYGSKAKDIVKVMVDRFNQTLTDEMLEQTKALGKSIHELVIIASIIEKEAKLNEERPLISAVIHNRLKKGMYLQSCATVQYALPDWKPKLLYDDLRFVSPYNTYLNPGLPPGPIANPGKASLVAAFFPAKVDYLFFVAKQDGSHLFSNNYQEHLQLQNN